MKNILSQRFLRLLVFPVLAAVLFTSCKKSEDAPPFVGRSEVYKMYNRSTGSDVEAGTFTITELVNGNARLSIQLNQGYRVAGAKFRTTITVPQTAGAGNELLFANLGEMDGGIGTLEVNPIVSGATNAPIKYNEFIMQSGYTIKVMNGNNLQASGVIP